MLPPFSVTGGDDLFVCCLLEYLGFPVDLMQQQSGKRDLVLEGQHHSKLKRSIIDNGFQDTNETLFNFPHVCYIGDVNQTNTTRRAGDENEVGASTDLFLKPDGNWSDECIDDCNATIQVEVNCTVATTPPNSVTPVEEKVLVWLPRIFGPISLICSLWILLYIARDKRRRKSSYHRIVWAMSMINFCSTFWISFTTLPTPSIYGRYGARGNQSTCDAQGWFIQFSVGAPLYHASLSLYYYLRLCRQWSDRDIRKHAEPWIHMGVMGFSFLSATVPIPLKLYNPGLWCWIYELPYGCDSEVSCLRGYRAKTYQWGLFYAPIWGVITWLTLMLILIYCHVRRQENKTAKYTYNNNSQMNRLSTNPTPERIKTKRRKKRSHARAVASNAAFYISSFYIVWIAPTLCDMVFDQAHVAPFWLYIISVLALSLQGFFNFIVYIRPKFIQQMRKHLKKLNSDRTSSTSTEGTEDGSWTAWFQSATVQIRSTFVGFWNSVLSNPDHRENKNDWKLGTPDEEPTTEFATSVQREGPAVSAQVSVAGLSLSAAVAPTTTTSVNASLPIQASTIPELTQQRSSSLTHPT